MKGIFIPDITAEMFRNGCLESIETLMTEGEVYDIEYDPKTAEPEPQWIPCSERLPEVSNFYMVTNEHDEVEIIWFAHKGDYDIDKSEWRETEDKIIAWKKVPEPYRKEGGKSEK